MKQSLDFNDLGDKHKRFEQITTNLKLIPGLPVIARMDGRAFHTLTRNVEKPYDYNFIEAMRNTTKILVDKFNATVGYVQSDEITLIWTNLEMFDLKIEKLSSILASTTSVHFNSEIRKVDYKIPDNVLPVFDCRIFNVPTLEVAAENLLWRQWDAYRNSVSMAAHSNFSNKQLHKVNTKTKIQKLEEIGFSWNDLPSFIKRGSFFIRKTELKTLTTEELNKIQEKYRPTEPVLRSVIKELEVPPLTQVTNKVELLFGHKL